MSIPALSNAGFTQLLQAGNLSGFQQAVHSLGKSLTSGNVAAAKTALNQLQQVNANQGKLGGASINAQLTTDLSTLGAALKSGSLASAKTAFVAVANELAGSNAAAVKAAGDAAQQIAGQIDAVLGLTSSRSSASISVLLGTPSPGSSTPNIASQTTSLLSGVYGDHGSHQTGSSTGTAFHAIA